MSITIGRLVTVGATAGALVLSGLVGAVAAPGGAAAPDVIEVAKFAQVDATKSPTAGPSGSGGQQVDRLVLSSEFKRSKKQGKSPLRRNPGAGEVAPLAPGGGTPTSSGKKAKSNPQVLLAFEGLNHRDSRLADDGDAFSGEPADQGVCVGNGYIVETVNSAVRVFDARTGAPVSQTLSLNEFYGFEPAIIRPDGPFGPFTFDISCHYDPGSNRWFHLAVDLDQHPVTGDFTGDNYLDLAVSTSGDPTGAWNVYRIPGMNDGTQGTPDHNCPGGPCFADFPHIGVDRNGVYISTNEFPFFADGFTGAQVYAISKADLVAGANQIEALLYDTSQEAWEVSPGQPGFTVWPALAAGRQAAGASGGSQFFVSSNAVFDDDNGDSSEVIVWALSNTRALDGKGFPRLTRVVVPSQRYAVPPPSAQKDGVAPLRDCLNDTAGSILGQNCGAILLGVTPPQNEDIGPIDTSDSRVLDVRFANGKLWAVLGTAAEVGGQQRAGVGWFVLNPSVNAKGVTATIRKQGILALAENNLAYPTLAVTTSGRGVLGFTEVGPNTYPSYSYASIDDVAGVGPVRTMLEGQGVQDGFTEYDTFSNRPRWGDYGAAAVDGRTVYLAGQYIAAPGCSLQDYVFTDCDNTRTALANWSTAVGVLNP